MLSIVVNNITSTSDDLKERVLQTMKKQIKKKLVANGRTTIKPNCDAPFIVLNNIEQNTKNIL